MLKSIYSKALFVFGISAIAFSFIGVNDIYANNPEINNDLVGHWDFNAENRNETSVFDLSQSQNNGVINGVTFGEFGFWEDYAHFDGVDDSITILDTSSSLNFTDNFTIEARIQNHKVKDGTILASDNGRAYYGYFFDIVKGKLRYRITSAKGGTVGEIYSVNSISNSWVHVAVTHSGTELKLYINGKLDNSNNQGQPIIYDTSVYHHIGRASVRPKINRFFKGEIDNLKIHNKALTSDDIREIYYGEECIDYDEDGYGRFCELQNDCDDGNSNINPAAAENVDDGVDNNCNGEIDEDYTINNNLIGYWNFDAKNRDNDYIYDLSQNQSNGMIGSATFEEGVRNDSVKFDGIDDSIVITDNSFDLNVRDNFTIEAFIKNDKEKDGTILASDNGRAYYGYFFDIVKGKLHYRITSSTGGTVGEIFSNNYIPNSWTHVAITHNYSELRLYINGELDNFNFDGEPIVYSSSVYHHIGRASIREKINRFFRGNIDELKIHNRVLTPTDIREAYEEQEIFYNTNLVITKLENDDINVNKIVAAGELGIDILKIKLEEVANSEDIIVKQLNFPEYNLTGNIKNYTLSVGGQEIGYTVYNDQNADISFTNLNEGANPLIVPMGGSVIVTLSADVYDSTNMPLGETTINGSVGVGYYEYTGAVSGNIVTKSGGVFTATEVSGSYLNVTVNDASLFNIGDYVFIDINGDGILTSTENANNNGFLIVSVNTITNKIQLADADVATAVSGKENWISATNVRSNIVYIQDVKPVASTHFHTEGRGVTSQMITENVAAVGTRELKINQVSYKVDGIWSSGYGPRNLRLYDILDNGNESNVLSSTPKLAYTPGINVVAGDLELTSGNNNDTNQLEYVNNTPDRELMIGTRIKVGNNINNDIGYRIVNISSTGYNTGSITVTPTIDASNTALLIGDDIISVVSATTTTMENSYAGDTAVVLNLGTDFSKFTENSVVVFYDSNNGTNNASTSKGHRITSVIDNFGSGVITFTPPLEENVANGAIVVVDGTALVNGVPVEPGAMVRFTFANGNEYAIDYGYVIGLTLVGDTSTMTEAGGNPSMITVKGSGTKVSLTDPFPHIVYSFTDSFARDHENLVLISNVPVGATMY